MFLSLWCIQLFLLSLKISKKSTYSMKIVFGFFKLQNSLLKKINKDKEYIAFKKFNTENSKVFIFINFCESNFILFLFFDANVKDWKMYMLLIFFSEREILYCQMSVRQIFHCLWLFGPRVKNSKFCLKKISSFSWTVSGKFFK